MRHSFSRSGAASISGISSSGRQPRGNETSSAGTSAQGTVVVNMLPLGEPAWVEWEDTYS
jgi:hypothetical protein